MKPVQIAQVSYFLNFPRFYNCFHLYFLTGKHTICNNISPLPSYSQDNPNVFSSGVENLSKYAL